jgi:hypothetical protein
LVASRIRHTQIYIKIAIRWRHFQSGEESPHSKTWPTFDAHFALAFWSAAVFRRFQARHWQNA